MWYANYPLWGNQKQRSLGSFVQRKILYKTIESKTKHQILKTKPHKDSAVFVVQKNRHQHLQKKTPPPCWENFPSLFNTPLHTPSPPLPPPSTPQTHSRKLRKSLEVKDNSIYEAPPISAPAIFLKKCPSWENSTPFQIILSGRGHFSPFLPHLQTPPLSPSPHLPFPFHPIFL